MNPTPKKSHKSDLADMLFSLYHPPSAPLQKTSRRFSQSPAQHSSIHTSSPPNLDADKSISQPDNPDSPNLDVNRDAAAPHSLPRLLEDLVTKLTQLSKAPKSSSAIKFRIPDIFDGSDPSALDAFTFQCSMYIAARSADFPDDESRVTFVLSYLGGTALDWFQSELNCAICDGDNFPIWFQSYSAFISELRLRFGPQDPAADATAALEELQYEDSTKAARYTISFNQHAFRTGWNDRALSRQYYKGLPDRIKDEIARVGQPADLQALQTLTATLDQRYWDRQSEIDTDTSSAHSLSPLHSPTSSENSTENFATNFATYLSDNPSENSAENFATNLSVNASENPAEKCATDAPGHPLQASAPATSSINPIADLLGPDGKLKPEERQRRLDNGLCLRCGKPGHMVSDCPRNVAPDLKGQVASLSAQDSDSETNSGSD